MHRAFVVVAGLASFEVAHAGGKTDAELVFGGGGGESAGYALASTRAGARLLHRPDIRNRAIECQPMPNHDHLDDEETAEEDSGEPDEACLWMFTGIDVRALDEIGASVEGSVWANSNAGLDGFGVARAFARGAGWRLEERLAIQPVGELHDRVWMSGRGVVTAHTFVEIPPMFAFGTHEYLGSAVDVRFDTGQRWRDGERDPGFDYGFDMQFLRFFTPHTEVDFCNVRVSAQRLDEHVVDGHTYGLSAEAMAFEALALAVHASDLTISGHIGFTDQTPVYHSVSPATTTSRPIPWAFATDYAVDAAWKGEDDFEIALGIGSWLRLKPEAESIDYGHLASATLAIPHGTTRYRLRAEGGYLDRVGGSPFLPPPPRTREFMGRLDGEVAWRVSPHIDMVARLWGERSDRDDPHWAKASMENTTHVGADLTARLH